MGFDTHSVIKNPMFTDSESCIPERRLNYGTPLQEEYAFGLASSHEWNVGESPELLKQDSIWQVGAVIIDTDIYKCDKDSFEVALIPKPDRDGVLVSLTGFEACDFLEVSVFTVDGKYIYKENIENQDRFVDISLASGMQGLYLFRLRFDSNTLSKLFVII